MRLINVHTNLLEDFFTQKKPRYAVLSHRWTKRELSYSDVCSGNPSPDLDLTKFRGAVQQAKRDGLHHVWIDTCCIDKMSSTELSEAINSMYRWYQKAQYCYVYLHDVDKDSWKVNFHKSKWFTRGWTLQELLAPSAVLFYDHKWQLLGDKTSLANEIYQITGIDSEVLESGSFDGYSVAQKMSWAARRTTTRVEDSAYCLMGLFGVNMPLLYGEGDKAFIRLQEEIIKDSDDHSIFAWSMGRMRFSSLLAPRAASFAGSGKIVASISGEDRTPFSMTNRGLSIKLNITPWSLDTYLAYLYCEKATSEREKIRVGIFLRRLTMHDQYVRVNFCKKGLWLDTDRKYSWHFRPTGARFLLVCKILDEHREQNCLTNCVYGFKIAEDWLPPSAGDQTRPGPVDSHIATLPQGGWGCAAAVNASEHKGLEKFMLGFDFDFNPVCLLQDHSTEDQAPSLEQKGSYDWNSLALEDKHWNEIVEGGRIYHIDNCDGMWLLRGDRLKGLNLLLPDRFTDRGALVTIKRTNFRARTVWSFCIESLVGPFRSLHPEALKDDFGSRRNFQAAYGLGMTDIDLNEGDDILKAMYDPLKVTKSVDELP